MISPMVDIFIPVYHRPQNVKPLIESLFYNTPKNTVRPLFIVEDSDVAEREAIRRILWVDDVMVHRLVVPDTCHTFAHKVNLAFNVTMAPWVLLIGDDVRFHKDWLDGLLRQIHATVDGAVFGTMDSLPGEEGESRVEAGQHATHILLDRTYVENEGGGWDRHGILAHEGYHHWYVDDEIVTAAKQRGVWGGVARESIIEHLHPLFDKSDDDEVYREGQSHSKEDKVLFRSRYDKYVGPRKWPE